MAIFFADFKIIGRSKGQSAVASAAYQAGEDLIEDESHEKKRFSKKAWQVKYSEIMLPENAPKKYADRATLWNAVQKKEKAKNAQFARKAVFALPKELDRETQIKLSRTYIQENFVDQGMVADWAIHDKGDGNPHVHIQLTMRPLTKSGKWGSKWKSQFKLDENGNRIPIIDPETGMQKVLNGRKKWQRENITLDWNRPEKVTEWRNAWEKVVNPYLKEINAPEISAKSYEEQGIDRISTLHEGYFARKIEKISPGSSRVIAINRAIKARNRAAETVETVTNQVNDLVDLTLKERSLSLDEILSGTEDFERTVNQARHSRGLANSELLDLLGAEIKELKTENQDLQQENEDLLNSQESLNTENADLNSQIMDLRQQVIEWQQAYKLLESKQVNYEKLKLEKQDLQKQINQLQSQLTEWEELEQSLTSSSTSILGLLTSWKEADDKEQNLRENIKDLKSKLQQLKN